MGLGPRLDLRQSQSLVMTPQLQQAIKLLALSNLEIEGFIAEELERNPLLDTAGDEGAVPEREAVSQDTGDEPPEPATTDQLIAGGDAAADAPLDVDYAAETFHHDGPTDSLGDNGADSIADRDGPGLDGGLRLDGPGGSGGGQEDGAGFEAMLADEPSLHDHLMAQAGAALSGADLAIAALLIDQIDEAGYFTGDLLDVAQRRRAPLARVEQALATVQTFEPTGVGARSLAECLALQAKEADRYDPAMARLIANLPLVAKGALPQLRRLCGVDEEDMADMVRELRGYDPKPGLRYGASRVQAVVPDLFVARTRTGWAIELNGATLPRLLVNRGYHAALAAGVGKGDGDREGRAWLSECLASANWLVKALDQRARTIMKVATEIVRQQEAFFLHGVGQLKPLTLRAVADAIGMHESTVSRVTSNKYLSCERGLYELKYFFTSGIQSSDGGDAASAEAVKSHLKALIAAEGDAILSDDKLVELLNARGFDIARRTVAKYREAIGLGSSVQRRRQRVLGRVV
ncbi:RNA polymerase factor sigma-54 [Sphingomonas solaris]|uniref:RNA polymerase sigma-54 factor n=1 Tax=Alterirhizorhabdus solaris TaxID=2529389 RepID=A0A558QS10_9SPHN|nr:RNA polymerase factor sigma-54 [Sphingomonas solaris]TVV69909.1 RNA polymerase factor sigma-54 [Sphingomonas solaris]